MAFSPDLDGQLVTSGAGHIRFWAMSSTFTGLKLQGFIGKFGTSELTDIVAFIQMPDGKVLSSTETGNLLLWEGGSIKCEISCKGKKPCHAGKVEVILLDEGEVISAGVDGVVRVWDFESIDNADISSVAVLPAGAEKDKDGNAPAGSATSTPRVFEMEPVDEITIGKDVQVHQ